MRGGTSASRFLNSHHETSLPHNAMKVSLGLMFIAIFGVACVNTRVADVSTLYALKPIIPIGNGGIALLVAVDEIFTYNILVAVIACIVYGVSHMKHGHLVVKGGTAALFALTWQAVVFGYAVLRPMLDKDAALYKDLCSSVLEPTDELCDEMKAHSAFIILILVADFAFLCSAFARWVTWPDEGVYDVDVTPGARVLIWVSRMFSVFALGGFVTQAVAQILIEHRGVGLDTWILLGSQVAVIFAVGLAVAVMANSYPTSRVPLAAFATCFLVVTQYMGYFWFLYRTLTDRELDLPSKHPFCDKGGAHNPLTLECKLGAVRMAGYTVSMVSMAVVGLLSAIVNCVMPQRQRLDGEEDHLHGRFLDDPSSGAYNRFLD